MIEDRARAHHHQDERCGALLLLIELERRRELVGHARKLARRRRSSSPGLDPEDATLPGEPDPDRAAGALELSREPEAGVQHARQEALAPEIVDSDHRSVLAPARPQLALDLFKAIRERGCDVEDCRFAPIGDRLAASLVVSGNWSALGRLETALPGQELQVTLERVHQLGHALALRRDREQHRRVPRARACAHLERRAHRVRAAVGAVAIGLVDHEQVADLHQARLHRLDAVARLGHQHDRGRVRGLRHLELALADALQLPFADNTFDLAYGWEILHHIAKPEHVIAEMARVSRKYVLVAEPNPLNLVQFAFALADAEHRWVLRYRLPYMRGLFEKAGLQVIHASSGGWIFPNKTPMSLLPVLCQVPYRSPIGISNWVLGSKRS